MLNRTRGQVSSFRPIVGWRGQARVRIARFTINSR